MEIESPAVLPFGGEQQAMAEEAPVGSQQQREDGSVKQ